jgi:N-acetylglutamate synthase-like GNAT family acetyltransferase
MLLPLLLPPFLAHGVWLQALLEPLQRTGVLVRRTSAELRGQLPNFTVIERETKV